MDLAGYQQPRDKVEFTGGSLDLRGLSLNDFSQLLRFYKDDLESLFDIYENVNPGETDLTAAGVAKFAIKIISDAPGLVGNVIAMSCDQTSPEAIKGAMALPPHIQLLAIQKIGELTFSEVGGVKKFVDLILSLWANVKDNDEKKSESKPD